jgi:SAM-dependent methyltransferase
MDESFTHVAPWYDLLMAGVPYEQWVRYLEELLERFNASPRTVLDLACGTGRVSRLLAQKGYGVVGVDGSPGMIEEARKLTPDGTVRYECARMESFSLDRSFDLIVSLFDSLNYLTDPVDLGRCFTRVAEHMNPNGLFIFDMNGEYAFEADLFSQESYGRYKPIEYTWKSHYDRTTRICTVDMQFFVRVKDKREEFKEIHIQRAYSVREVNDFLKAAGLNVLATYEAYSIRNARAKSDRIFWVAQKPGE